jgi:hypothetical protein
MTYEEDILGIPQTTIDESIGSDIPPSSSILDGIQEDVKDRVEHESSADSSTPPTQSANDTIKLSYTQQMVFDKVLRGENVFFTGSAGAFACDSRHTQL